MCVSLYEVDLVTDMIMYMPMFVFISLWKYYLHIFFLNYSASECVVALCTEDGTCEETVLENFPCKGAFPLDEKDNTTWCKRAMCVGRDCVLENLKVCAVCMFLAFVRVL